MCTKNELNVMIQKMAQIYRSVYGTDLVQVYRWEKGGWQYVIRIFRRSA